MLKGQTNGPRVQVAGHQSVSQIHPEIHARGRMQPHFDPFYPPHWHRFEALQGQVPAGALRRRQKAKARLCFVVTEKSILSHSSLTVFGCPTERTTAFMKM